MITHADWMEEVERRARAICPGLRLQSTEDKRRVLSRMKFCYCDESGTGDEPIAVMVGIVVDAQRMHLTKADWAELLETLSQLLGGPSPSFIHATSTPERPFGEP